MKQLMKQFLIVNDLIEARLDKWQSAVKPHGRAPLSAS